MEEICKEFELSTKGNKAVLLGRLNDFLISQLAHLLKSNCVDVAILNNAPPLLQREVVSKGKLIFRRSEPDRIRFEIGALTRYVDTAHLRNIKRLYMKRRIEKGLSGYA